MNSDLDHTRPVEHSHPAGWRESLAVMISSRIEIFQIELQQAVRDRSRSFVALAAAALCIFFTWALLLAGGIAALAVAAGWPWHLITLVTAAGHLLAAFALVQSAKKPKAPSFPVTQAEFQKDREWIENLQKKPASKN